MRYVVQHPYRSYRDGRDFGPWQEGETVELDDELDAEWVNRDSPGTLIPESEPESEAESSPDGEDQAEEKTGDGAGERQQPEPRNRQRKSGPNRKS